MCSCCEPRCLEIKCPYSINYTSPLNQDVKLPYLKEREGEYFMNRNHKYYTQVQVQMAVTKIKKSVFMIWTPHGHFLEEIDFDSELWDNLQSKFINYYENFYLKTIFKD